ncbi:MAG: hypothetical protein FJY98_01205 [Candidatus Liptonbacteria bacterium]|nr:hypothetical protein [Candidatus Liptonbacteria bacterium]
MKIYRGLGVFGGLILGGLPFFAFAQTVQPITVRNIQGVEGLIYKVVDWVFLFLIAISILMILVAAYYYMTAQGNSEKVSKGHKTITWAAVGIMVALLAKGVPAIVRSIFAADGVPANQAGVQTAPRSSPSSLPPAQLPGTRPALPPAGSLTPGAPAVQ